MMDQPERPSPPVDVSNRLDYLFGLLEHARAERHARRRITELRAPYIALIRALEDSQPLAPSA